MPPDTTPERQIEQGQQLVGPSRVRVPDGPGRTRDIDILAALNRREPINVDLLRNITQAMFNDPGIDSYARVMIQNGNAMQWQRLLQQVVGTNPTEQTAAANYQTFFEFVPRSTVRYMQNMQQYVTLRDNMRNAQGGYSIRYDLAPNDETRVIDQQFREHMAALTPALTTRVRLGNYALLLRRHDELLSQTIREKLATIDQAATQKEVRDLISGSPVAFGPSAEVLAAITRGGTKNDIIRAINSALVSGPPTTNTNAADEMRAVRTQITTAKTELRTLFSPPNPTEIQTQNPMSTVRLRVQQLFSRGASRNEVLTAIRAAPLPNTVIQQIEAIRGDYGNAGVQAQVLALLPQPPPQSRLNTAGNRLGISMSDFIDADTNPAHRTLLQRTASVMDTEISWIMSCGPGVPGNPPMDEGYLKMARDFLTRNGITDPRAIEQISQTAPLPSERYMMNLLDMALRENVRRERELPTDQRRAGNATYDGLRADRQRMTMQMLDIMQNLGRNRLNDYELLTVHHAFGDIMDQNGTAGRPDAMPVDTNIEAYVKRTADEQILRFRAHFEEILGPRGAMKVGLFDIPTQFENGWNQNRLLIHQAMEGLVAVRSSPRDLVRRIPGADLVVDSAAENRANVMKSVREGLGFPPDFDVLTGDINTLPQATRDKIREKLQSVKTTIATFKPRLEQGRDRFMATVDTLQTMRRDPELNPDALLNVTPTEPIPDQYLVDGKVTNESIRRIKDDGTLNADQKKSLYAALYFRLFEQLNGTWDEYITTSREYFTTLESILNVHLDQERNYHEAGDNMMKYISATCGALGALYILGGRGGSLASGGRVPTGIRGFIRLNPLLNTPNFARQTALRIYNGVPSAWNRLRGPGPGSTIGQRLWYAVWPTPPEPIVRTVPNLAQEFRSVQQEIAALEAARVRTPLNAAQQARLDELVAQRRALQTNLMSELNGAERAGTRGANALRTEAAGTVLNRTLSSAEQGVILRMHSAGEDAFEVACRRIFGNGITPEQLDALRRTPLETLGRNLSPAQASELAAARQARIAAKARIFNEARTAGQWTGSADEMGMLMRSGITGRGGAESALSGLEVVGGARAERAWTQVMESLKVRNANVAQILEDAAKRGLIRLDPRTAELIANSRSAQRIIAGAQSAEDVQRAVMQAERAAIRWRVGTGVALAGLDVLGLYMAYVEFEDNNKNIERARATGNTELARIYQDAQVVTVAQGGLSAVGLVVSGVMIFAPEGTALAAGASFVGGTILLPVGIAMAAGGAYYNTLKNASATFTRKSADWMQKPVGDVLSELERLSRREYTWGEMSVGGTNAEHMWNGATMSGQEYDKWFNERYSNLEGGAAGTRAELCAAYAAMTTYLPKRTGENDQQFQGRLAQHIRDQMAFLGQRSRMQYDVYFAQHFNDAKQYADMMMRSRELQSTSGRQMVEVEVNGRTHQVNLAEFSRLPFRADGVNPSQSDVLRVFSNQQRGMQLMQIATVRNQQLPAERYRPYNGSDWRSEQGTREQQWQGGLRRAQEQLHGMFLSSIREQLDRFEARATAFDFNGIDWGVSNNDTYARNVVRQGMARRVSSALEREQRTIMARGTFTVQEFDDAVGRIRAILQENDLQAFHDQLKREHENDPQRRNRPIYSDREERGPYYTSLQYFQYPPTVGSTRAEFIAEIAPPEVATDLRLTRPIANTYQAMIHEELTGEHTMIRERRAALIQRRETLVKAAREGTLARQAEPNLPGPLSEQQIVFLFEQDCAQLRTRAEELTRRVARYESEVSGPNAERYRLTRDTITELTRNVNVGSYNRSSSLEQLLTTTEGTPAGYSVNVRDEDQPVIEELIATLRTSMQTYQYLPGQIQSASVIRRSVDGADQYLLTFSLCRSGIDDGVTLMQVGAEKKGNTLTIGGVAMPTINRAALATLPYPRPRETPSAVALLQNPTGDPSVRDESGRLMQSLPLTPEEATQQAPNSVQQMANRMHGSAIVHLYDCTEQDLAVFNGLSIIPRTASGSPMVGTMVQKQQLPNGEVVFLFTSTYFNDTVYRRSVRFEPNGTMRVGTMEFGTQPPAAFARTIRERREQRANVQEAFNQFSAPREVGRDSQGNTIYGVRNGNQFVLFQYVPGERPGDPEQLRYHTIEVREGSSDASLEDYVRNLAPRMGAQGRDGRNWQHTAQANAANYRMNARMNSAELNVGGRNHLDVRLNDNELLLTFLATLPRPGVRPGESEDPSATFDRALNTLELGRNLNPLQRQHLLQVYRNAVQNDSTNSRVILQLMMDRIAVHQEQVEKPNLRPGEQLRDVVQDIQNMAELQAAGRYTVPPPSPGLTGQTPTPTFGPGGPGAMPFVPGGGPIAPGGAPPRPDSIDGGVIGGRRGTGPITPVG